MWYWIEVSNVHFLIQAHAASQSSIELEEYSWVYGDLITVLIIQYRMCQEVAFLQNKDFKKVSHA